MFFCILFLSYIRLVFCVSEENVTFSQDDFKCSLPDVTSLDDNLDVIRFRSDFSKISEVKFPGLIGPLNERLICKIKCIDGNWVGPLCSSTPDGRFQPILRECLYRKEHPLLAISFKNSSIDKDTPFPHGSVIVARCRHFGLYKLKGEGALRCENGEWEPKMPECVPTTVVTNFTGDAPPTIQYTVVSGSAVVQPSGVLYVYPESSIRLDCVSPRALGEPDWSWTQALGHHNAAWSTDEGEKETHYRLVLSKMSARHSDQYTCTAPGAHTNTVLVKVVNVMCPPITTASPRIRQFAQGSRLGHSVHFSCQPGFHLEGDAVLICMGDGHWSSPPPACAETLCPPLGALGPQLGVVEYNASAGGRAVFACAWGYRLTGAPGLECGHDGMWSGNTPQCIPIYCPDPLVPENGRILTKPSSKHGKYSVGDLMFYACDDGLQLVGESSIVCTENGFWSHPPPFCLPPSEIRKTDTIYIENTTLVHLEELDIEYNAKVEAKSLVARKQDLESEDGHTSRRPRKASGTVFYDTEDKHVKKRTTKPLREDVPAKRKSGLCSDKEVFRRDSEDELEHKRASEAVKKSGTTTKRKSAESDKERGRPDAGGWNLEFDDDGNPRRTADLVVL